MRGKNIAGFLDLGSSKIVCMIVAFDASAGDHAASMLENCQVIGLGHQRSRGFKAGIVADMDEAEQAIRAAVSQAEQVAGVQLDHIYVSVSCGRLKSQNFTARAKTESGIVEAPDVLRVMEAGRAFAEREGRSLVHLCRVGMALDGIVVGGSPYGMAAHEVAADLHTVSADETPLRNLIMLIERCYLEVAGLVVTPFASALAVTTTEERRLGVTVVDIGGGTSTLAAYVDGQFVHADAIPIGGQHLSFDIARNLQTPLEEAERIKTLYGTLLGAHSDEYEFFSYSSADSAEGGEHQASKAQLASIIRPRMTSILELVRERVQEAGVMPFAGNRIVLTGGASQLSGLSEFAANVLQCPVRVSRPAPVPGLSASVAGPSFATVVGMVAALGLGEGAVVSYRERNALMQGAHGYQGYVGRVGQWLKEGF